MQRNSKIFVVGGKNIIGCSIADHLNSNGFNNIFTDSTYKLNLTNQNRVCSFFRKNKPEYVFLGPSQSGGINANITYPAEFIYNNLQIQNNIIHFSYRFGVKKLLFFGSSCVYPHRCPQPIKEEFLLSGALERTSEPYSIAKIAGIKTCQAYGQQYNLKYIIAIPATIYGPNDKFDLAAAHVIPSLIRKFHKAKINKENKVIVWGTGRARREFLYADDFVRASIFLMNNYDRPGIINIGYGEDISIRRLTVLIRDTVGFTGDIVFDKSKPDGALYKLLDSSKIIKLGWQPRINLEEGIRLTYKWYISNNKTIK